MLRLYSYFRSSASWRVRIGLHLKHLDFELVPVHLLKDGGEQHAPGYHRVNPMETVPLLEVVEGGKPPVRIGESLAILQYLDEVFPEPPLLPANPLWRAKARWIAELINSGIHPLQNLGPLQRLEAQFGADAAAKKAWAAHWIHKGLAAVDEVLRDTAGTCCVGNQVTLADLCLLPQAFNARRQGVDVAQFPVVAAVCAHLEDLPAFRDTDPFHQPDTPAEERRP